MEAGIGGKLLSPMEPLRISAYTLYLLQINAAAYIFPVMISVYLR